ncbi:MAG: PAS domain-containing sensor histidine kinase [Cyanobacteria bacterium J06598_3]
MLEFIGGLSIGLVALFIYRRRDTAKLKRLLSRLEDSQPLPNMGYDAQLVSAIANRQAQSDTLGEQLEDLRSVLKNAPLGYLQVDEENRLLWCNQKAQDFLDIDQGDYVQPRLLLAVVRSYELDQLVDRTRKQQTLCESDWTFNSISTDPFNYLERPAYPLRGHGLPLSHGHVGVFLENRQEAVSLAQQRDRWISDVAHELKTPLTSIRLVAETLQSRVAPALTSWVDRLLEEVIRLSRLVDDVLNMSHLEQRQSEKQGETGEEIDLVHLVDAAWQSLEPLAKLKQVDMRYDGPKQLVAKANGSLMHRVFFNLMSNAVRYSPMGQAIRVQLSTVGKHAVEQSDLSAGADRGLGPSESGFSESGLSESGPSEAGLPGASLSGAGLSGAGILIEVLDAGVGFADKDLPHVFDRFYRADPARSRENGADEAIPLTSGLNSAEIAELSSSGTGLGLAIVRQIVTSHGGRVEARNHSAKGGGWLRVWLPGSRLVKPEA